MNYLWQVFSKRPVEIYDDYLVKDRLIFKLKNQVHSIEYLFWVHLEVDSGNGRRLLL